MEVKEIRLNYLIPSRNLRTERIPKVQELAESIREHGLLQPIRVRPLHGETYQIIAGHRRAQAHRALGRKLIDAVVVKESDETAAVQSLVENLQREDLTPLELARGVKELAKDYNLDTDAIARLISKSPGRVRTWMRFSNLPDDILARLKSGERGTQRVSGLTPRHVEPFIRDLPSKVSTQLDENATSKYLERLSEVRAFQDEVKRRNININAHMADAIAKEFRHSGGSVGDAIDKVLSEPERYRYKSPRPSLEHKEEDSDTGSFTTYEGILSELVALANKLNPALVPSFSESERNILLRKFEELEAGILQCRNTLTSAGLASLGVHSAFED